MNPDSALKNQCFAKKTVENINSGVVPSNVSLSNSVKEATAITQHLTEGNTTIESNSDSEIINSGQQCNASTSAVDIEGGIRSPTPYNVPESQNGISNKLIPKIVQMTIQPYESTGLHFQIINYLSSDLR